MISNAINTFVTMASNQPLNLFVKEYYVYEKDLDIVDVSYILINRYGIHMNKMVYMTGSDRLKLLKKEINDEIVNEILGTKI